MKWSMPDSTVVADLPPGFPAYLGYVDGALIPATCGELAARFPGARRVCLTTTGQTLSADGIDCEPGNVNAAMTRVWVQRKLGAAPASRPVIYASVVGQPNFGMGDVLAALARNGIGRDEVRLLSAHYGAGEHICGPATCGEISVPMDGTQWTDQFPGLNGSRVDMSLLDDGFFQVTWTERLVQQLPTLQEGATGKQVERVQALCNVTGFQGVSLAVDGQFGWKTKGAVEVIQVDHGLTQDGVVGQQTWPVLLGIA